MKRRQKEKGMVLAIALILILPLTLIAVSVMQWSREDLKMIGAVADRNNAEQDLIGVMQKVLLVSNIASILSIMPEAGSSVTVANLSNVNITIPLTFKSEVICKRRFNANSDSVIKSCRYVDADNSTTFAKGNIGQLGMTLNIEQPLLSNSGG
jgi:type IV pilus assembly protein PilX